MDNRKYFYLVSFWVEVRKNNEVMGRESHNVYVVSYDAAFAIKMVSEHVMARCGQHINVTNLVLMENQILFPTK